MGVIRREIRLVGPIIAITPKFTHQVALWIAQNSPEYFVPPVPHHLEQAGGIHLSQLIFGIDLRPCDVLYLLNEPTLVSTYAFSPHKRR